MSGSAAAAVLISLALWISRGDFDPAALGLMTAAAFAALFALRRPDERRGSRIIVLAGVAAGLAAQLLEPGRHPYFVLLAWIAVCVALTFLLPDPPPAVARLRFPLLLACFAAMGAVVLLSTPAPGIDVWFFQYKGAQALLHGQNPYELLLPNIYGHDRFYGPGMLVDGKVVVFPYPPLVVALDAVALLLGDVRWLFLAGTLFAAACIRRLGRGPDSELAAALVLFQPTTFFVLGVGWTEPTALAGWAATLLFSRRWTARAPAGWIAAAIAAGLLLATKQYTPLFLLPLALAVPRDGLKKAAALALAVAAATALPFAVWNFGELWRDVVVAQFLQPFRDDALSWLAAFARWTGRRLPSAVGFAAAGAVLAAGLRRRLSLQQAATVAGAAFLFLVLFNKQAFCNYYWLASGLFASAAALESQP